MTQLDQQLISYEVSLFLIVAMKLVLFVISYKIVYLGYNLILAGAKGEFKLDASYGGIKGKLTSISPGLLFVALGVCLAIYTISVKKPVTITATVNPVNQADGSSAKIPMSPPQDVPF